MHFEKRLYELDSEDVLMDVILVDKSMKFDLIPV